ncbi:MAG TPA: tetratricopeptide repeat protein, partial [Candidatus Ozemobacteraceae bacterium]|nr:tetratricopeptide repeat protein [Candidatus Ozemobacteraceae bacterium]
RLFYGAQLAAVIGQETFLKGLIERIQKVPLNDELAQLSQATSRLLEDRGYRHLAIKVMESALAQRPDDMDLQFALSEEYFLENRSAEAVKLLEDVVSKDASRVRAYLLLIDSLAACGRVDEAHQRAIDRMDDLSIPDLVRGQIRSRAILLADKISPERKASFGGSTLAPTPADASPTAASDPTPAWPTPMPAAATESGAVATTTESTDQQSANK